MNFNQTSEEKFNSNPIVHFHFAFDLAVSGVSLYLDVWCGEVASGDSAFDGFDRFCDRFDSGLYQEA